MDKYGDEITYINVKKSVIGFCGKLIPVYQLDEYYKENRIGTKTFYSAKNLSDFFNENKNRVVPQGFFNGLSIKEIDKYLKASFFERKYSSWFQTVQCPVFQIINQQKIKAIDSNKVSIKKNPILKTLDFYKIKDAYSAHQEISQYLGGVLTSREVLKENLTDVEKVKKHGFDEKYGFRTRPKK